MNKYQEGMFADLPAKDRLKREVGASGLSQKEWYRQHYLASAHWRQLREAKFSVSGKRCQQCGNDSRQIHVHHLSYKFIYDVTVIDLLVVCHVCHDNLHAHEHTAPKCAKPPIAPKPKPIKVTKAPTPPTIGSDGLTKRQRKAMKREKKRLRLMEEKGAAKADALHFIPQRKLQEPLSIKRVKQRYLVDRDVVPPARENSGMALVTKEMIDAIATPKGAWIGDQMEALGVGRTHNSGWYKKWEDKEIPLTQWYIAEAATRLSAHKTLLN